MPPIIKKKTSDTTRVESPLSLFFETHPDLSPEEKEAARKHYAEVEIGKFKKQNPTTEIRKKKSATKELFPGESEIQRLPPTIYSSKDSVALGLKIKKKP